MDEIRIEKLSMEDGRTAERHIREEGSCDEVQRRIIDLYVEPERPKKLAKRITEETEPRIVRRIVETIDENGDVIDRKVESTDPSENMRLVEHIASYNTDVNVSAQSVEDDCGCPVTRDDLKEVVSMLMEKISEPKAQADYGESYGTDEVEVVQDHIETKVSENSEEKISTITWILLAVVVVEMGALVSIWM